jgi:ABC-type branched-subunit amino acid transport system ATPase component
VSLFLPTGMAEVRRPVVNREAVALSTVHLEPAVEPALVVTDLSVRYGAVRAVVNMNLEVRLGEVHGLIGPNGAGKTSFVDAITGFERTISGRVVFRGSDISRLPPHRRALRGLVRTFQNLELFRDLTVRENLKAAAGGFGAAKEQEVHRVLEFVGMGGLSERPVAALSHAHRRMVTIARAMMAAPSVLVLDESAAGLDEEASRELGVKLRELARRGIGLLLVDHDMSLVLETCDRITVMDAGALLSTGTPAEIRANQAVRQAYLGEE